MSLLPEFAIFLQIVLIDVALAGDNAMAIGMAAAGLPTGQRHRAIIQGVIVAALLRILFAVCAVQMLHIAGLLAIGGLLLLWISWKMYEEIRRGQRIHRQKSAPATDNDAGDILSQEYAGLAPHKRLSAAILQIAVADISMSLDNVLAVAGIARDHLISLIFGLALSVLLMGVAASFIARIINRRRWVAWLGLAIVFYTALRMIWEGGQDVWRAVT